MPLPESCCRRGWCSLQDGTDALAQALRWGLGLWEGSGQHSRPQQSCRAMRGMHRSAINPAPVDAVLHLLGKYPECMERLGHFPTSQRVSTHFPLK